MDIITNEPEYEIRYSKLDEDIYLKQWMEEDEVKRWYPVSTEVDIDDMTKNWIGFARFGASLTAFYKGEAVGIATLFLMPYRKLIHHAMVYFIVNPKFYSRGVGTSLVRNISHLGATGFRLEKVYLEIYDGCPALSLLQKNGFEIIFRQAHFVKEGEDRYLGRIVLENVMKKG